MAQILQFNGGKKTRLSPHLLNLNEGVIYLNIDNTSTSLAPIQSDLNEVQNFGANTSFYHFGGGWIARSYSTSYVEFQEKLYFSDSSGIPQKTSDGSTFFNLGISTPSSKPTTVANDAVDPLDTKTRQYCYTYYNANDGTESAPSEYSNELSYTTDNVTITNITVSTDPQVTHIRLYRLGGAYSEMLLVVELAKTATSYADTVSDINIPGSALSSQNGGQAPSGLAHLSEYNAMLFGAISDKLYFSDVSFVNDWSPFFFLDFDSTIIGLGSTPNGLLVFTKDKTYIVSGSNPVSLSKILLHGTQGCINHKTIKYIDNTLAWLSMDGICTSNGSSVHILTLDALGKLSYTAISAEIWDSQYYLFHTLGTLVIDFRYGQPIYKDMSLVVNGTWYSSKFDKLYYVTALGALYSLFNGSSVIPYTFKTGRLTEGLITMLKNYKVFYAYIEGTAQLKIYIDGSLVLTKSLVTGFNEVKIPQAERHGYYIEFEFTGTGKVLELEYKVEGRQNGR
jgi:hypothetical protein